MPRGAPATLSDKTYVDIVSYVLKVNEFPAGAQELRVEDLPRIQLIGKDGPEPVPDFSLVRVVALPDDKPFRRRLDADAFDRSCSHGKSAARCRRETRPQQRLPLGPGTFRLLVSAAYKPDDP